VSTDQTGPLIAEEAPPITSPIENELPTYRAISTLAVFSVLCGALAVLSFAELAFLIFAVLAVVLGFMANVAIKRSPDRLTGRGLANAGIALGLVFGLTVVTYTTVQAFILKREASNFALLYAKVLKEGSFGDAMLMRADPEARKNQTAAEAEAEFKKMQSRERGLADQKFAGLIGVRKALAQNETHLHLIGIEDQGEDDGRVGRVGYFAFALYELEGPPGKGDSDARRFALAILKGYTSGRHFEWHVEDVIFPYTPKSYQTSAKPVDDGHGHAPGAH
jgi:Domain of unknown function (DUF4190)